MTSIAQLSCPIYDIGSSFGLGFVRIQVVFDPYFFRDVSKACSFGCCPSPFVGLPDFNYALTSIILSTEALQTQSPGSTISLEPPFFYIFYKSVNLNDSQLLYGEGEKSEFQPDIGRWIMAFMNISEANYSMVLTANQSSAFKLLSECHPFQSNQNLLTVYDYQNEAVEVMTESSKKRGANVMSADFSLPNLQIQSENLRKKIKKKRAKDMETLGLSLFNPDFLICSFFKVFGENPPGFCCLFIRKSSASILKDLATGTNIVGIMNLVPASPPISNIETKLKVDNVLVINTSFEPGTTETNNTPKRRNPRTECRSLDHADSLGLILISNRTRNLTNWLVNALMSLKHPNLENGNPAVQIYGPKIMFDRRPAVAFIQKLADRNNISLSIGFLQHIWFPDKNEEKVLETRTSEAQASKKRDTFHLFLTNFDDTCRLWPFVSRFLGADFLEKEKWRYKALNQKTIEV
ncbi:hypothetical protein ES288_A08G208200v1 [Gossypium darwinii]|uniref:Uncharacterized protein n=1 Tax=Gossypium darwinii TaxID=34276 RepID=A0A5D2FMG5_GOSDA|nr:hypothetical protein ES288_A08G208200v1 [Gossypium darwinii]